MDNEKLQLILFFVMYREMLFKYPQQAFPYSELVDENQSRGKNQSEFGLLDTGIFDGQPLFRRLC